MYRENVYVKELEGVGLGWVGGADTSLGGVLLFPLGEWFTVKLRLCFITIIAFFFLLWPLLK